MKPYYEHGGITIYHGDCREVLPLLPKAWCDKCACAMEDESILAIHLAAGHSLSPLCDSVITDPPYNFSTSSSGVKHSFWADAINAAVWFRDVLAKCAACFGIGGGVIWQFLNWKTSICLQKALHDEGLDIASMLVWDKCWIGPGGPFGLRPSYELVALILIGEARIADRGLPDIWRHQWAAQRPNGHPAEKPIELLSQLCLVTPGIGVLDPFCGSGTTLVAAKRHAKRAIGIEIEEKYCEIAAKRLSQEVFDFK